MKNRNPTYNEKLGLIEVAHAETVYILLIQDYAHEFIILSELLKFYLTRYKIYYAIIILPQNEASKVFHVNGRFDILQ